MNAIKGFDHVGVRVADFERSIEFYEQLGFAVIREDFNERVVVLLHKNGITLNLLDSAMKFHEERNVLMDEVIRYAGYTHIAMRVTDIKKVMQYLKALDIVITEGPVTFGDGKTSIFFRDPDRNVIELTQSALLQDARLDYE